MKTQNSLVPCTERSFGFPPWWFGSEADLTKMEAPLLPIWVPLFLFASLFVFLSMKSFF